MHRIYHIKVDHLNKWLFQWLHFNASCHLSSISTDITFYFFSSCLFNHYFSPMLLSLTSQCSRIEESFEIPVGFIGEYLTYIILVLKSLIYVNILSISTLQNTFLILKTNFRSPFFYWWGFFSSRALQKKTKLVYIIKTPVILIVSTSAWWNKMK